MAFTYDLSTSAGKVRLKIGDTSSTAYVFEDAEIAEFLSEGGTVTAATILALRALYVDKAKRAKFCSLPGMSFSDTAALEHLKNAIAMYGGDMPTVSVIEPATQPYDTGFTEPTVVLT